MTTVEQRLSRALQDGAARVDPSRDLFARVVRSVEEDRKRRGQHRRAAAVVACLVGALASVIVAVADLRDGRLLMAWWILELLTNLVLIGLALWLGPFIRRFGRSYAADVFRANPQTGKSFIVLADIAYYLIFTAFILFTVRFEPYREWGATASAGQLQYETSRLGGILLIIGILHGVNLLVLPAIGRLFTLNRRLDEETPPTEPPA
jgi:type III secretory pathway component EscS